MIRLFVSGSSTETYSNVYTSVRLHAGITGSQRLFADVLPEPEW